MGTPHTTLSVRTYKCAGRHVGSYSSAGVGVVEDEREGLLTINQTPRRKS